MDRPNICSQNNNAGSNMTKWRCRECWQAYRGPQTICLDICSISLTHSRTVRDITHRVRVCSLKSAFVACICGFAVYRVVLSSCFCLKCSSSHSHTQQQGLRSLKSYTEQTEADSYPVFALPACVLFVMSSSGRSRFQLTLSGSLRESGVLTVNKVIHKLHSFHLPKHSCVNF